jgi:hypothetical protein
MINTINLTTIFLRAYKKKNAWSEETLLSTLHLIASKFPFSSLDWDHEAGEMWARFLRRKDAFVYVRVNMPLVFVLSAYAGEVESLLLTKIVIAVPNMNAQTYSLDTSEIGQFFPEHSWPVEVNPAAFSINELWYATVT